MAPIEAVNAGAAWRVDGGDWFRGQTAARVPIGTHQVTFSNLFGWITPQPLLLAVAPNKIVTAAASYRRMYAPLGLNVQGHGTVLLSGRAVTNQSLLAVGGRYTMTAKPDAGYVFSTWSGSAASSSVTLTFTMGTNTGFTASFVTNRFLAVQGTYSGLFAPTNTARQQTNSGAFTLLVSSNRVTSGNLMFGTNRVGLNGTFSIEGDATIVSLRPGKPAITTRLQMNFEKQEITGTVSDGNFLSQLLGDRSVFSFKTPATNYAGQYTLIIPGTNNSTAGPFGIGYGTAKVSSTGQITFSGSLADGTPVSQSTTVSQDGFWPIYLPLYGGKGSIWSWALFTNREIWAASRLSWINPTNANRAALYREGFTNQNATLMGSWFVGTNKPLLNLTNGTVVLIGGDLSRPLINRVILSAANRGTNVFDETNKLRLSISKTNGLVTGNFADPARPSRMINFTGVVMQNQSRAFGYFSGTNQSGAFRLDPN